MNYAHDSGVMINRCMSCRGIWLQSGQLERLARYRAGTPAIRSLENAMAAEIRKSDRWQSARRVLRSRLLSGIVVGFILLIAWLATGYSYGVLRLASGLLFPLVCIWFPDAMGNLTRRRITHPSHPDFLALAAWLVLLTVGVVLLIRWL